MSTVRQSDTEKGSKQKHKENQGVRGNRTRKGSDILKSLRGEKNKEKKKAEISVVKDIRDEENNKVRRVVITEKNDGQRLDNFLISFLKGVPKSHIYRIVRGGEVRVNKGRAKVDTKLNAGDEVRIPPIRLKEEPAKYVPPITTTNMPTILYEDEHLLIVDKPAGMACHGGSGISYGLIERLRVSLGEDKFLELAHRLDRDTSGAIILAKTRKALVRLHEMMREGQVQKVYLTLVKGDWVNDRQHIKFPLHKYLTASGERRVRVDNEIGLPSHSIFTLKERFGEVSYLEVELKTGRTHQIRVHAQASGFPLVGDDKYGDFEFNEKVEHGLLGIPFKRMFLHAHRIAFNHPVTGNKMIVESPLPKDCKTLIETLEKNAN